MSMHKIPLSDHEKQGLENHHLPVGTPSQLSDCFRLGVAHASAPLLERIAALEAQVEQAAQPVAQWQKMHPLRTNGRWENTDEFDAKWWRDNSQGWDIRSLYTSPPKAVPLTQPEKQRLWNDATYNNRSSTTDAAMEYGSAIEAYHGITPATVEKG